MRLGVEMNTSLSSSSSLCLFCSLGLPSPPTSNGGWRWLYWYWNMMLPEWMMRTTRLSNFLDHMIYLNWIARFRHPSLWHGWSKTEAQWITKGSSTYTTISSSPKWGLPLSSAYPHVNSHCSPWRWTQVPTEIYKVEYLYVNFVVFNCPSSLSRLQGTKKMLILFGDLNEELWINNTQEGS